MYVCVCMCVYVCVSVCMCVCAYVHVSLCILRFCAGLVSEWIHYNVLLPEEMLKTKDKK